VTRPVSLEPGSVLGAAAFFIVSTSMHFANNSMTGFDRNVHETLVSVRDTHCSGGRGNPLCVASATR
jgi:hypothetical protein